MEILVRPSQGKPGGASLPGEVFMDPAGTTGNTQVEQALEPKALFLGRALEVYSRNQAKTLGERLVSPEGAFLKFNGLVRSYTMIYKGGLRPQDDAGSIVLVDPAGAKWLLPFYVVGPKPGEDWKTEPVLSGESQQLRDAILAGDWPKAMDPKTRKAARKTSPYEPLLLGLDLLESLDHPGGKETQMQETAATLALLAPRNPGALSICATAYLASGRPDLAGRLRAWVADAKLLSP
jgi:hypothetical protein